MLQNAVPASTRVVSTTSHIRAGSRTLSCNWKVTSGTANTIKRGRGSGQDSPKAGEKTNTRRRTKENNGDKCRSHVTPRDLEARVYLPRQLLTVEVWAIVEHKKTPRRAPFLGRRPCTLVARYPAASTALLESRARPPSPRRHSFQVAANLLPKPDWTSDAGSEEK